jgi:hypothetical protein
MVRTLVVTYNLHLAKDALGGRAERRRHRASENDSKAGISYLTELETPGGNLAAHHNTAGLDLSRYQRLK